MDCKKAQSLVTPYLLHRLNDRDLSGFLKHVCACPDCHEELEIYFTVYYVLALLDQETSEEAMAPEIYDVQGALRDHLSESQRYLRRRGIFRACRAALLILIVVFFFVFLIVRLY